MRACRRSSVVLVVRLSYAFALRLFTCGRSGHQIVVTVAARGLGPAATAQIALLAGKSLSNVSALPDTWRRTQPETANWHFANIPRGDTAYEEPGVCPPRISEIGPYSGVAAIETFKTIVANRTTSKEARGRTLTSLVHIVGDIHQPFHGADNNDRGGNHIAVTRFAHATRRMGSTVVSASLAIRQRGPRCAVIRPRVAC